MRLPSRRTLHYFNIASALVVVGITFWIMIDDFRGYARDLVGAFRSIGEEAAQADLRYMTDAGRLRAALLEHYIANGVIRPATLDDLARFQRTHDTLSPLRSTTLTWSERAGIEDFFPKADTGRRGQLPDPQIMVRQDSAFMVLRPAAFVSGSGHRADPRYLFLIESGASLSYDGHDGMPDAPSDSLLFLDTGAFRIAGDRDWHRGFAELNNPARALPDVTVPPATVRGIPYPPDVANWLPQGIRSGCSGLDLQGRIGHWVSIDGPSVPGAAPVRVVIPPSSEPIVLVLTSQQATFWVIDAPRAKVDAVLVASRRGARVVRPDGEVDVAALSGCLDLPPLDARADGTVARMAEALQTRLGVRLASAEGHLTPIEIDLSRATPVSAGLQTSRATGTSRQ